MEACVCSKVGKANATFSDVFELTRKELRVTASCVSTGKLVWFDRHTYVLSVARVHQHRLPNGDITAI
jgi:hypothetical protein